MFLIRDWVIYQTKRVIHYKDEKFKRLKSRQPILFAFGESCHGRSRVYRNENHIRKHENLGPIRSTLFPKGRLAPQ